MHIVVSPFSRMIPQTQNITPDKQKAMDFPPMAFRILLIF